MSLGGALLVLGGSSMSLGGPSMSLGGPSVSLGALLCPWRVYWLIASYLILSFELLIVIMWFVFD